ncbi:hypothetical protein L7F22_022798 [Adiantum nelumboides]|nr:hypothetical protein [Adiantum nelumboides]
MLEGYPRLFIDGYDQITGVVQHHIKLKDGAKPVVQRLRRLGVIQQDALLSEVRKLLNAGFIYPIEDSKWVSPIVVTPKKNGKWQVCVDYKPLNAATKRDHFPLPFKDEILNEVVGYERYTVCDGYSGYFQIKIAEEDKKKTTFVTPWGCFAYRVMPFGLTNAPATFQRFVAHVFQLFFGKSIRVFIDDFCIYSSCILHLQKVNEDIAFAMRLVSHYKSNLGKKHWEAGDMDKRRFTSSYVFLFTGGAASWRYHLQNYTAMSTTEAEYVAASKARKEAIWLACLVSDVGISIETPTLHCDSKRAILLAKNPVLHVLTKHIVVKCHFIQDVLENKHMQLVKAHTNDNLADLLTKKSFLKAIYALSSTYGC